MSDQAFRDMCMYGPCPSCGTARTTRYLPQPGGGIMLEMICPDGCSDLTMEQDLDKLLDADGAP